ncbi:MAG: hypothetical protein LH629_04260, partial [Ignavibacteria bacterium]|nr:hypothetical protein [Ignavibacteria bacterium]
MKRKIIFSITCIAMIALLFVACKKKDKNNTATLDAKTQQFHTDNNNIKSENDQANDDINNTLSNIPSMGGRVEETLSSPMCGCTLDTSDLANKIVYFNFDSVTPCFSPSRTRSGQIKAQLISGNKWGDVGAVLKVTFNNFKVTRSSDLKSVEFNGSKTLENINGNNWLGLLLGTADFNYRERAFNINVTFDDGSIAIWNSARITTWSYNPSDSKLTFTTNGDTTINGISTVDSWGVNRFSQNFTINYNTPWVSNSYCGFWRPNSGQIVYTLDNASFSLTLGVDQNGNATPYVC